MGKSNNEVRNFNQDHILHFLVCPECSSSSLTISSEMLKCKSCYKAWPSDENVIDFRKDRYYFYDFEYSEKGMSSLLHRAKEKGWFEALKTTKDKNDKLPSDYFAKYNSSLDRAPWIDLLPIGSNSSALDYGCGMGAISASLAQKFGKVMSFDATIERAKFASIRCAQEEKLNVGFFSWDGLGTPPLKKKSFDAVILNGVLEWTPESIQDDDPRNVHIRVLKDIYNLLKSGGKVYIGIENRFAVRYLLGSVDHHSGLRFVTLLPRKIANLYSKLARGQQYRVYTYSLNGYKNLLKDAGFSKVDIYDAFPRYMFPEKMISIDDEKALAEVRRNRRGVENLIARIMSFMGLAKYVVFTYGIIGHKKG